MTHTFCNIKLNVFLLFTILNKTFYLTLLPIWYNKVTKYYIQDPKLENVLFLHFFWIFHFFFSFYECLWITLTKRIERPLFLSEQEKQQTFQLTTSKLSKQF